MAQHLHQGSRRARPDGCLFCHLPEQTDGESLIVARGETTFTALNRYPYTTGHVMIAPFRHVAEPGGVDRIRTV